MSWLKKIYWKYFFEIHLFQILHAIIFSQGFRREIISVYTGIHRHKVQKIDTGLKYKLRRNIHRLEKGLIMQPRRPVFALAYIGETIAVYEKTILFLDDMDSELKWFNHVLDEFFSVTGKHPIIDKAFHKYSKCKKESSIEEEGKSVPSERKIFSKSTIDYDAFFKLCRLRRSVRWYQDKKVPRELVDKAILSASQSPSACNRQPFKFRIFDEPSLVKKISSIPGGTVGFTHQFPMIIVIVGELDAYEYDRDRHLIYIDGSLAAMTFMLALETVGLSSCPINWSGVEEKEVLMDEALNLKTTERPVMLISVGYAKDEGKIPFSHKKGLREIRKYN